MRSKSSRSTRKDELKVVIADSFQAGDLSFEFAVLHHTTNLRWPVAANKITYVVLLERQPKSNSIEHHLVTFMSNKLPTKL